jgi:hypothetical protein
MPVQFDLTALTHRRSAKFVLASLIAVVAVMLALFTARVWRSKPGSANNAAAEQAHAPALTQEPLGHLLITIRPTGFDPEEIVQSKGEYLLAVVNRSGLIDGSAKLRKRKHQ